MHMHGIKRLVMVFGALAGMALGLSAQAQDVLSLPQASDVRAEAPTIKETTTEFRPGFHIAWTDTGAATYIVKAKIVRTGERVSVSVPQGFTCYAGGCSFHIDETIHQNVFLAARHGDDLAVRVKAKYGGGIKAVSAPHIMPLIEADPAELLSPTNGAVLHEVQNFTWVASWMNQIDLLVIIDVKTGQTVATLSPETCEDWICSVNPFAGGTLVEGRTYKWFVKSKFATNEVVKSEKRTFTLTN
jgi:hypothetical protein